jgi:hypothetical protein
LCYRVAYRSDDAAIAQDGYGASEKAATAHRAADSQGKWQQEKNGNDT